MFLLLLTGLTTGLQVLGLVIWLIVGRTPQRLELCSLVGLIGLILFSFLSPFRPHWAARGALACLIAIWLYYSGAMIACLWNIVRGSTYPWQCYAPPVLLTITTIYCLNQRAWRVPATASSPAQNGWKIKILTSAGITMMAVFIAPKLSGKRDEPAVDLHEPRKIQTLSMSWQAYPTDARPGAVGLLYRKDGVECSVAVLSPEFKRELERSGSGRVPVVFAVSYDLAGQPVSAWLAKIGDWPAERFSTGHTKRERLASRPSLAVGGVRVSAEPARAVQVGVPARSGAQGCFEPAFR